MCERGDELSSCSPHGAGRGDRESVPVGTSAGGQEARDTYDPARQLGCSTLPDASDIGYEYDDDGHRPKTGSHRRCRCYVHSGAFLHRGGRLNSVSRLVRAWAVLLLVWCGVLGPAYATGTVSATCYRPIETTGWYSQFAAPYCNVSSRAAVTEWFHRDQTNPQSGCSEISTNLVIVTTGDCTVGVGGECRYQGLYYQDVNICRNIFMSARRIGDTCPAGSTGPINGTCTCNAGYALNPTATACVPVIDIAQVATTPRSSCAGNPIYPAQGTKRELLDTGLSVGGLRVQLSYDSTSKAPMIAGGDRPNDATPRVLGALWASSLHRRVLVQANGKGALVARGDGYTISFNGNGTGTYTAEADTNDRLLSIAGGYRYIDAAASSEETYDTQGVLTGIAWANGDSASFTYSTTSTPATTAPAAGYLIQVRDNKGRAIGLTYQLPTGAPAATGGLLATVTDAAAQVIQLAYDTANNLASVTWADARVRNFVYDTAGLPWALSGVRDELAVRYATFGYDALGRAISTEYAGGVNRFSASYTTPPQVYVSETYDSAAQIIYRFHAWALPQGTVLVNPQGANIGMGLTSILGKTYVTSRSQPAGSGCAASTSNQTYDTNGNTASKDDFNATRACYANDLNRNLETTRVEGLAITAACSTVTPANVALPSGSRKTSTQWHPDWRIQTKRAEAGRTTTFVYSGQPDPFNSNATASCAPTTALLPDGKPIAVLCKQVEQATTDADGSQGLSATLQAGVVNRETRWTYNQYGQVLTEDGPRTDVNDVTTYAYYSDTTAEHTLGDLRSITNAAGKVTQYTKYNKHGQLLESIDPNGVLSVNTYDLRQRLLSTSVGGQTTSYSYDPVGQLTRVTQPDASFIGYEYDDAHRQKAVFDNRGNRIEYTLDNSGTRIAENVKDPGGALRRTLSRSVDALGRVQQTIGRE